MSFILIRLRKVVWRIAPIVLLSILAGTACSGPDRQANGPYRDAKRLVEDYLTLRRDGRFAMKALPGKPFWKFEVDTKHQGLANRLLASFDGEYVPSSYDELMSEAALSPVVSFAVSEVTVGLETKVAVRVSEPTREDVLKATGLDQYWWDRIRTDAIFCPNEKERRKREERVKTASPMIEAEWPKRYPSVWQAPVLSATRYFKLAQRPDGSVVLVSEYGGAIAPQAPMPRDSASILANVDPEEFACYGDKHGAEKYSENEVVICEEC